MDMTSDPLAVPFALPPVANANDGLPLRLIVHFVNDPVIPNAHPVQPFGLQLLHARGPRFCWRPSIAAAIGSAVGPGGAIELLLGATGELRPVLRAPVSRRGDASPLPTPRSARCWAELSGSLASAR